MLFHKISSRDHKSSKHCGFSVSVLHLSILIAILCQPSTEMQGCFKDCPIIRFQHPENNSVHSRQFSQRIYVQLDIFNFSSGGCDIEQAQQNISISWNGHVISSKNLHNFRDVIHQIKNNKNRTSVFRTLSWNVSSDADLTVDRHLIEAEIQASPDYCSEPVARLSFVLADSAINIQEIWSTVSTESSKRLTIFSSIFGWEMARSRSRFVEVYCDGNLQNRTELQNNRFSLTFPCAACRPTKPAISGITTEVRVGILVDDRGSDSVLEAAVHIDDCNAAPAGRLAFTRASPLFSDLRCVGGMQEVSLYQQNWGISQNLARTCQLENVCWADNAFVFYENPWVGPAADSAFSLRAIVANGLTVLHPVEAKVASMSPTTVGIEGWAPLIRVGPLPVDAEWAGPANVTHALDSMSIGYNFGHFLLDSVLPAEIALQIFDLDATEFRRN